MLENATITLLLVDHNSVLKKEDWQIRQLVLDRKTNNSVQPIVLFNKSDLPRQASENELESFAKGFYGLDFSSKTGVGLDPLEQQLVDVAKMSMGQIDMGDPVLLNIRQKNLVSKALAALNRSIESFSQNLSQEFISAELRFVLDFLGELIGEVTTEDILGNIFSNFCIGK